MKILRLASLSLIAMMVIPFVAYAHCPNHAHCGNSNSDPVPNYNLTFGDESDLTITSPAGVNGLWSESQSGGRFIGLQQAHTVTTTIDLRFFAALPLPASLNSDVCFSAVQAAVSTPLFAATLEQKNMKKGEKEARGSFWFLGHNTLGQDVNYILQLSGKFKNDKNWPGENTLTMDDWDMGTASGNGNAAETACTSVGDFFVEMILKTPPI